MTAGLHPWVLFMAPLLILVRHAAVQIDPSVDSHQWPLTVDGRSATHQLAHQLKRYQPQRIFSSEEPKAVATGAALQDVLGLPIETVSGLQEHDRRGVPYFANRADFETAVAQLFACPDERVFGRETAVQARQRFSQAVDTLCQTHPQETLILTTHGTVLTLFISHHNPSVDPLHFWQKLTLPWACILTLPDRQLMQTISV